MTAATTESWSSKTQFPQASSTTSRGCPKIASSNHPTVVLSPNLSRIQPAHSPNYFEFASDPTSDSLDSNAGPHAKEVWSSSSLIQFSGALGSSQQLSDRTHSQTERLGSQPDSNASPRNHVKLSKDSVMDNSSQQSSNVSSASREGRHRNRSESSKSVKYVADHINISDQDRNDIELSKERNPLLERKQSKRLSLYNKSMSKSRETVTSPVNLSQHDLSTLERNSIAYTDERHPRNSLPHDRAERLKTPQRAETLPEAITTDNPSMISASECIRILRDIPQDDLLILDLRVYPQYSKSRIHGAINLCIPTTLLKRSSFNLYKLSETFTREGEKAKFVRWRQAKYIIVYDSSSVHIKDATSCVNTLKKFSNENFDGATLILRGGFSLFAKGFPDYIDQRQANEKDGSSTSSLSLDPPAAAPVAGGCMMPGTQSVANPFFGSIRQNMDLIGGVGQIPVALPAGAKNSNLDDAPLWLRRISKESDDGKAVAERFLRIEKAEQRRMQKALQVKVDSDTPNPLSPQVVQIAGIEKGSKNRYKDMLPYDHSRVKLQSVVSGDCDYVNASHMKAEYSHKQYIASQAPVPATYHDFWRVVWEQDVRVIVMLTAETEAGQQKCHPYWLPSDYGCFQIESISERRCPVSSSKAKMAFTNPIEINSKESRPSIVRRQSTTHKIYSPPAQKPDQQPDDLDYPDVTIRKLTLTHVGQPFEPLREITQLQYSSWPDFGTPAHPRHILGLVEHCEEVVSSYDLGTLKPFKANDFATQDGERPILVHCSAGCGRTGTFCTVDSVIDMLKHQRKFQQIQDSKNVDDKVNDQVMEVDLKDEDRWLEADDEDLVAKTVGDFRLQRQSMVQTLRQFVLCYESILEWIIDTRSETRNDLRPARVW